MSLYKDKADHLHSDEALRLPQLLYRLKCRFINVPALLVMDSIKS